MHFLLFLFGAVAVKADITRRSPERQEKELEFLEGDGGIKES